MPQGFESPEAIFRRDRGAVWYSWVSCQTQQIQTRLSILLFIVIFFNSIFYIFFGSRVFFFCHGSHFHLNMLYVKAFRKCNLWQLVDSPNGFPEPTWVPSVFFCPATSCGTLSKLKRMPLGTALMVLEADPVSGSV